MARPMPATGALAWACSPWTPRKMGTHSLWRTIQALQVGLQALQGVRTGRGSPLACPPRSTKEAQVKYCCPLGSGSRLLTPPSSPTWYSSQQCEASWDCSPILQSG